jgi:hypothetical protein
VIMASPPLPTAERRCPGWSPAAPGSGRPPVVRADHGGDRIGRGRSVCSQKACAVPSSCRRTPCSPRKERFPFAIREPHLSEATSRSIRVYPDARRLPQPNHRGSGRAAHGFASRVAVPVESSATTYHH